MEDKAEAGLLHVPASSTLALRSARVGLIARGRRDAKNISENPHYQQAVELFQSGAFVEAAGSFRRAAEEGHAESQYILSTMYEKGNGVQADEAEAVYWAEKAAQQGHLYAQAGLTFRYYSAGQFAEAFQWCQRAADNHLPWAQCNLGLMYRKGEGVPQSDTEAAYWYRMAARQGMPEAQQKLADLCCLGVGVPRDYTEAARWYRKAADQGNAEAQFQLGTLYQTGLGVEHDYTQYRYWTRQAAIQGHEEALREVRQREYRDA